MSPKEEKTAKQKTKKKKRKSSRYRFYSVEGNKAKTGKMACPKCGAGVFMAEHKDRWHCGACGYTKWKRSDDNPRD
jgi:small subunit ribosomal protein S27Ae